MDLPDPLSDTVDQFIAKCRRRQTKGSHHVAKQTAELLRNIVGMTRWGTARKLLDTICAVGRRLDESNPTELLVSSVVKRVLFIIREEYNLVKGDAPSGREQRAPPTSTSTPTPTPAPAPTPTMTLLPRFPSLSGSLLSPRSQLSTLLTSDDQSDYSQPLNLRGPLVETLNELIDEIGNMHTSIADQALEHIHANEVILTFGESRTVKEFLLAAAKKRRFEVIVAETAPACGGHEVALTLSQAGIHTTMITDSAIFAMMARVNTVIVGTHAVLANGGLLMPAGGHMVAVSAKHHMVPFVVCTGMHKLCPSFSYDQDTFNDITAPTAILKAEESHGLEEVDVIDPAFDYIPPELVTLYITNYGGYNPSYIYRLLAEYYSPEDNEL